MRILRVVSDLYPFRVGGIGMHAHELSKWQARFGHEVTVYTIITNRECSEQLNKEYAIVKLKPIISVMGNSFSWNLFHELFRTRNRFDIIHAHSHLFFSTNLCALVKKLGSPPLVITNHGLFSQTVPSFIQKMYIPTLGRWTLNSADRVICYTKQERSELIKLGIDPSKIRVIHNGIDTEVFTPSRRVRKKSAKQILWVGRFVPGKGVRYLIDAFNILIKECSDIRLLLIGQGPLKNKIRQKIDNLGLSQNIIIEDFIPNSRLPEVYQQSDIFVLPSINEGVPRTLLEAMSCGIPVVCTNLPHLADIIRGCGLLVPPRDPVSIAKAVSKIIFCKEVARELGWNGRKKVIKNHSWKDTVKKILKLYEDLI